MRLLLCGSIALAGCHARASADTRAPDADWPMANHDYAGTRYSGLAQITRENVRRLTPLCRYAVGTTASFQSNPVVIRGTMYLTTSTATIAVDATTCRERWKVDRQPGALAGPLWGANRGAAVASGLVVRGTLDGLLVAYDTATGALRWERQIADPSRGETLTMPPLVVGDRIIIGPAGNENAVAGWVGAFVIRDGTPLWRTATFLASPESPVALGGGAVWTPITYDTARALVYVATGNPAPDFAVEMRDGDERYTNAVVALDIATGAIRWHRQLVARDAHDWDLTQSGPLVGDRVLVATGKDGIVRALDRETHRVLWQTAVTRQENTDAPITTKGTYVCPGVFGGVLYNGAAYSDRTGLLYLNSTDLCGTFTLAETVAHNPPALYVGGDFKLDPDSRAGWTNAIDARTGVIRWRRKVRRGLLAAVTATAGGLVFTGELDGDLVALDALSGRALFRHATGGGMGGGIVTYATGGRQYVAALTGRPSAMVPVNDTSAAHVIVYGLR